MFKVLVSLAALILLSASAQEPRAQTGQSRGSERTTAGDASGRKRHGPHFQTSDRCVACHNGMTTPAGEDVSIGVDWRTSMMANAARDPYWMAGVRREILDHPSADAHIQDECSICHMPMMRYEAKRGGGQGTIFAHLPPDLAKPDDRLSDDGVSCSVCHQIADENLGKRESFVGRFSIDESRAPGERTVFGPFEVENGLATMMRSSSTFKPAEGAHIRSSELCATCHTLITQALDAQGRVIGELPEQVPYQEWQHSDFQGARSCQSCHMPAVGDAVPITSVFGAPRDDVSRHTFVGGNFFMQRMLNRFRGDLSVRAQPQEMETAARRTIAYLQSEAARVSIQELIVQSGRLEAVIEVQNLGGHKLPTAYPSRRAWLHVAVRDRNGQSIFDSGSPNADGSIHGNDNDEDAMRFEPHYREITRPDQVQIYESVMVGMNGTVTTGLLTAVRYIKDNRLLPKGFDKRTADQDVAVHGDADSDEDFIGGSDRVRYSMAVSENEGPFQVEAEVWFQPVAYRWAMNLKQYDAEETRRFVRYYEAMASGSSVRIAAASATR